MTLASVLQTPDTLLLILCLLDGPTIASFRLTSHRINSIIITHQKFICNSIALQHYSTNLDFLPSIDSIDSPPLLQYLGNLHIKALLRIPRARLLVSRAVAKGNEHAMVKMYNPADEDACVHCTRGILVFWALVDIQQSVSPDDNPAPRYIPKLSPPISSEAKWRGMVTRLFRPRDRDAALKAVSASVSDIDAPASSPPPANSTPSLSASSVAQRFATIKSAQQPFVNLLSRPTRIDLELAQSYLHWLMPFSTSGYFGGPSLAYKEQCWWKESWALRQGPAFVLAVSSTDSAERQWALNQMETEWKSRGREVGEVERTTPIFLFRDEGMGQGERPLWEEAWKFRDRRTSLG